MKTEVLNFKKEKVGEKTLHKDFKEMGINTEALTQYVRAFMLNKRQGNSSTKNRGEVSGSGIKPWRQKGTGRARVGSKRTPLWRHGGIINGPRPKSWSIILNKKIKKLALVSALNQKMAEEKFMIVDSLDDFTNKTKKSLSILKKLKLDRGILVISDKNNETLNLGLRNISSVDIAAVDRLNAFQVLKSKYVLISKEALNNLEKKLFKQNEDK